MRGMSKKRIYSCLTYSCVFLLGLNFFLSTSKVKFDDTNFLRYIVGGILIALFFTKRYFKFNKFDIIILSVCMIYFIAFSQSVALNIFILYLISYHLQDEDFERIKSRFLIVLAIIILIWLFLLITNIIPDYIYTTFGRTRHDLGFFNINQSSIIYLPFLMLLFDRYKIKALPFVVGLAFCLFKLTNTRTAFYILILYIILYYLIVRINFNIKYINAVVTVFIFILSVLFVRVDALMNIFPKLNDLLTNRLSIISNQLLILKPINYIVGGNEILLDNSYIILISTFGFLGLCLFLCIVKKALDNNSGTEWVFLVVVMLYGFSESIIIIPESLIAIMFFTFLQNTRNLRNSN